MAFRTIRLGRRGLLAASGLALVAATSLAACSESTTAKAAAPALRLSSSALQFSAPAGGPSPAAQTVSATNAGGGSLALPTATVDYGVGSGWLSASASGSAAPYAVAVQPDVAGLAAGSYSATVLVWSAGASGSPQPLAVSLAVAAGGWWKPAPGTSWQWQLQGTLDTSFAVAMYDVDLFDTSAGTIAALHSAGRKVVCYYSAGTYEPGRPDSASLTAYRGNAVAGWPGEYWLDFRQQGVLDVMAARLDLAAAKACDGVEPDNVDAYANNPGFGGALTAAAQLTYNRWTAEAAHARGLSVGLKNDLDQVAALVSSYDWALDEECFAYSECDLLAPFVAAGKAVFQAEYTSANPATQSQIDARTAVVCGIAPNGPNARNFDTIVKDLDLDALRGACR